ncbi:unnamed protein product [Sphenostylis stenocarpa]|uniref:Uncharacterized protein n=1 Tax=Sphenostylis stenocarpa TaxID=92480 RepID=A0AA86T767_9FABA|nr:unnamed protein product [Sphenostylis stenocarpa]
MNWRLWTGFKTSTSTYSIPTAYTIERGIGRGRGRGKMDNIDGSKKSKETLQCLEQVIHGKSVQRVVDSRGARMVEVLMKFFLIGQ